MLDYIRQKKDKETKIAILDRKRDINKDFNVKQRKGQKQRLYHQTEKEIMTKNN